MRVSVLVVVVCDDVVGDVFVGVVVGDVSVVINMSS